jgi:hypothetical protein
MDPEGLAKKLDIRLLKERFRPAVGCVARYKKEPMTKARIDRLNQPVEVLSAQLRHSLVTDNGVVWLSPDLIERLGPGIHEIHARSIRSQNVEDQLGDGYLVVDDKDGLPSQPLSLDRPLRFDLPEFRDLADRQFKGKR